MQSGQRRIDGAVSWSFEVVRVTLGLILITGGIKIAFPPDPARLAASYIDPGTGWISPFFADLITGRLGVDVATFLHFQGWLEIGIGLLLAVGIFTRPVAALTAALFWSFTVANPVTGQIRLSRDLTLMAAAVAVAIIGPGRWSLDRKLVWAIGRGTGSFDTALLLLRLGVAFALVTSALFAGGVFANPLNTTLPRIAVFALGVGLGVGVAPRLFMAVTGVWLIALLPLTIAETGWYLGLDAFKRELGLIAATVCYVVAGPDRWAAWLPRRDVAGISRDPLEPFGRGSET